VRDAAGTLAAISVVMPAARLKGNERNIGDALARVRDEIQVVLYGD